MRTRDEIEKQMFEEVHKTGNLSIDMFDKEALAIELLLDIRELLQNPPKEITGDSMKSTKGGGE